MLRNSMRSPFIVCSATAIVCALAGVAAAHPAFHDVVSVTGGTFPGDPTAVYASFWEQTHQSLLGNQVFYSAYLSGPGVSIGNNATIFSGSADSPNLIIRSGSAAPGLAGLTLKSWHAPVVSETGNLTFIGILSGPGITNLVNDRVIYAGTPGLLSPMLRDGQAAPLMGAGVTIKRIGTLENNGNGTSSFFCRLAGSGIAQDVNDGVLYYGAANGPQKLLRMGEQAAGLAPGVQYHVVHAEHHLSNSGKVGFVVNLQGAGVTTANNQAAYVGTPGNLMMLLRTGTQAPGQTAGTVVSGIDYSYSINNNGYQTFNGGLAGTGVTTSNDSMMFATLANGPVIFAREGSQAPGLASGILFDSMEWDETPMAVIGPGNRIMMNATIKGNGVTTATDSALWAGTVNNLQLLARESGPVPGHNGAVVWRGLTSPHMACNAVGQVVFQATMTRLATSQELHGVFVVEPWGETRAVVQSGDTLMVGAGDYRVVKSVEQGYANGGEMGGKSILTDSGLLMTTVVFTDNSSAVVRFDVNRVCPADFDSSGFVDTEDYDAFVEAFEAGINSADFDKSGFVDTDDFDAFVEAFTQGC
jgi:hypothetical protein